MRTKVSKLSFSHRIGAWLDRVKSIDLKPLSQTIGWMIFLLLSGSGPLPAQPVTQQYYSQPPNQNYLRNSQAFRQEIARFEITVHREGFAPLSLSQVPRVSRGDVLKVKLLDEAVNGIKPDQSLYDWTLLVAFINPNRKFVESRESGAKSPDLEVRSPEQPANIKNQSSVSEEIRFRQKGWYREHSFTVPYDSQPVFFLYPRPDYRSKILGLLNKNYNEIRKLGEKTIELAGAYARIGMFLNEMQGVLSGHNPYGYGSNGYGYGSTYNGSDGSHSYNQYSFNNYGYNPSYNYNLLVTQTVERLARSFNIQLPPNCWPGGAGYSSGYSSYPYGNQQPGLSSELVSRLQCVARNVRIEDFDFSVSKLLQQGGMLLAAQLQQKYPQLSYWINIAAFAVDFIVKAFKKTAMRIVPTVTSSSDNARSGGYANMGAGNIYQSPYAPHPSATYPSTPSASNQTTPRISVFAENQPDDNQFVTAYPIILHKWQAEADPEVISLRPPVLTESCLHAGINLLKSTDLTEDPLTDGFTKDYKLIMTSTNGFKKEFPLKKNPGLGGWELNLTPQDLQEFPRVRMNIESVIKGARGFQEIKSPPFYLPIAIGGSWEITPESKKQFAVGGTRTISIRNTLGNCQCLQAVIYKPSFGGQFVFESDPGSYKNPVRNYPNPPSHPLRLEYSSDGKEVSFELETSNFQPGEGKLELKTFGGEKVEIPLKLYPPSPSVANLKLRKGDREGIITGNELEQIQTLTINGRRAFVAASPISSDQTGYGTRPGHQNQSLPGRQLNRINSSPNPNGYLPDLQPNNAGERVFYFEDERAGLTENTAQLELELEDNRTVHLGQIFSIGPARPRIVTNEAKEVEGVGMRDEKRGTRTRPDVTGNKKRYLKLKRMATRNIHPSSLIPHPASTFPISTTQITLNVRNALTDYDFRFEHLSIETRLEKSAVNLSSGNQNPGYHPSTSDNYENSPELPLPNIEFEVLDWKNLRISLRLPEQLPKMLGGRRLQFRIRDRERGDSDWYSIRQTFVRIPEISSITCAREVNGKCEMKGPTIDYISQVSVDGGQSWYPQSPATLQTQPAPDGSKSAMIPLLPNKNLLMIKLRDFPKGEGMFIGGFRFSKEIKAVKQ